MGHPSHARGSKSSQVEHSNILTKARYTRQELFHLSFIATVDFENDCKTPTLPLEEESRRVAVAACSYIFEIPNVKNDLSTRDRWCVDEFWRLRGQWKRLPKTSYDYLAPRQSPQGHRNSLTRTWHVDSAKAFCRTSGSFVRDSRQSHAFSNGNISGRFGQVGSRDVSDPQDLKLWPPTNKMKWMLSAIALPYFMMSTMG